MDSAIDELAAIGRIVQAIKHFRQQHPGYQLAAEQAKDAYLKNHLADQDYSCWKQFQETPPEPLTNLQVPLPKPVLSYQQFKRLLYQYRRAGFESYQMQVNFRAANTLLFH